MAKRIQAVSRLLGNVKPPVAAAETFTTRHMEEEGRVIKELDPNTIQISKFYNREATALQDEAFAGLKGSIKNHGQDEPIRVRKTSEGDYELISGHRRTEACRQLNIKVKALVANVADEREAQLLKWRENEEREDISEYEKYRLFRSWLDAGLFKNNKELAIQVNYTQARISQILSIGKVPQDLLNALMDCRSITYRHAAMYRKLKKSQAGFDALLKKRIATLKDKPMDDASILDQALAPPQKKKAVTRCPPQIVEHDGAGRIALVHRMSGETRISIPKEVDKEFVDYLTDQLAELYEMWQKNRE
jgi:plasmid partitioning protein RepB